MQTVQSRFVWGDVGPVSVSQVGQRFFGGQDVPLRTFSLSTSHAEQTWPPVLAEEQIIINARSSLLTACLFLETDTKQKKNLNSLQTGQNRTKIL